MQPVGFPQPSTFNPPPPVTFARQLDALLADTLDVSLPAFAAELVVCATVVVLLLGRLFETDRVVAPRWVALAGAVLAFAASLTQLGGAFPAGGPGETTPLFTTLLVDDPLTVYLRVLLTGLLVLTTWLTAISGIPDREDGPDFHALLFGSTLGAMLMGQANHLLMLFLAVEMASVPGYALVGFQKGRRTSGEAALKYLVYGAGAAGVMLYGVSLLAGVLGTASLPELTEAAAAVLSEGAHPLATPEGRTVVLGAVFVFAGLAFKLAVVPFQFWCPDAFEGASAEAAGFLSVAPKAGAFALLVRFGLSLFGTDEYAVADLRHAFGIGLAVVAAATMTFGNLAAYPQENLKRLFAYSTIAHAGYMLLGLAAMLVGGPEAGRRGLEGLLYYLAVYVFMNLGAFAVVAFVRNRTFGETIDDCRGLGLRLPALGAATAAFALSLVGLPPTGGFVGKFMVFAAAWDAGSASPVMWAAVAVAAANTVFSLFYYLRVLKALYLLSPADPTRLDDQKPDAAETAYLVVLAVPVLALGVIVEPLSRAAASAAAALLG